MNRSYTRETTNGSDTLISQGTGQQLIIDSINTRSYSIEYWYDQISFDTELIFGTNSLTRLSFFGGIGGVFGTSVNAYTQVSESDTYSTGFSGLSAYEGYSSVGYSSSTSGLDNARNYSTLFYVPLGADFRIGTEREFWKKVHLFLEVRPYYSSLHVPESRVMRAVGVQNLSSVHLNW